MIKDIVIMRGKTVVKTITSDYPHGKFKEGDIGYIDGYLVPNDTNPHAVVVLNDNIVTIPIRELEPYKLNIPVTEEEVDQFEKEYPPEFWDDLPEPLKKPPKVKDV